MKIRNALLVGGRGYIGTNLATFLENKNIDLFFLDKSDGHPADQLSVLKEIDYVVHLAAYPGVKACAANFQAAVHDNISSAFRVFLVAYNVGIPVIFSSSQAAKFPEHSFYGTIKKIIEEEATRYNRLNGDFRVLRFTNVYGGQEFFERKLTAIPNMKRSLESKQTFVINGDGLQTRDFIHVDDICEAIWKCMIREEKLPEEPIDIGTGIGTSINEIVDIYKKNNKDFLFTFDKDSDIIGPMQSTADVKPAKELLGFESKIKLIDWLNTTRRDHV